MNRADIISEFVSDPTYKDMCNQIARADADDLYQELVLILLEMPADKLEKVNGSCMKCFFYTTAYNQYCSATSPFHKKYRKDATFIHQHRDAILQLMQSTEPDEDLIDKMNMAVKAVDWYDSEIMQLYAQHGTLQKVSDLVGIPLKSIHHTVTNTRNLIKKKINKYA